MGTRIKSAAVSLNGTNSSMALSVQAIQKCIEKAGIDKNDIDLLINVGIYHDDNLMEPAMAPLIQQQLGINLDPVKQGTMKFTFCFDLYNGACGFINALQVADATLKAGRAKHILIVSADTHPSMEPHDHFPFRPVGAAVLLTHEADQDKGFDRFYMNTSENRLRGQVGGADMINWGQDGIIGKKFIEILTDDGYVNALHEFSVQSAEKYFDAYNINIDKINFMLTSQQEKGFAKRLHDGMGLNGITRLIDLHEQYGDPHTSSLPLGLHQIMEEGALKENDTILLAAAGSGLTSAFAMYKV